MRQSNAEKNARTYARRPDKNIYRAEYEKNRTYLLATRSTCAICGLFIDKSLKSPDPMSATVDHIIPIARGGHPSNMDNLQLTHRRCNRAKGTKIITQTAEPQLPVFVHSRDWKKE